MFVYSFISLIYLASCGSLHLLPGPWSHCPLISARVWFLIRCWLNETEGEVVHHTCGHVVDGEYIHHHSDVTSWASSAYEWKMIIANDEKYLLWIFTNTGNSLEKWFSHSIGSADGERDVSTARQSVICITHPNHLSQTFSSKYNFVAWTADGGWAAWLWIIVET